MVPVPNNGYFGYIYSQIISKINRELPFCGLWGNMNHYKTLGFSEKWECSAGIEYLQTSSTDHMIWKH